MERGEQPAAKRRRVTALLAPELYEKLEQLAAENDRGTDQQAAHMLRRALSSARGDALANEAAA